MAAFTAVLVNIPMNWLLIFGFGMGISGGGYRIVIGRTVFVNRPDNLCVSTHQQASVWLTLEHGYDSTERNLFYLGMEHVAILYECSHLVSVLFGYRTLGEMELAVSNIVRSVSALFSVIVNALSGVTSSLVSNLIGAGEKKNVFPLCRRIIRLGYAAGVPLIVLALLFHQSIIGAYTENPAIVQAAWLPFAVMLLNYFFALPGYVYLNAVTGTGATRTVFIFQVTTTIAYLFCLWGLSHWNVPLAAYWAVEYLYVILLGMQAIIYLKYKQ